MKNCANQTAATTTAMPRSGCFTSIATSGRNSAIEIRLPGNPGFSFCSANSQAATIAKVGLTNSDGWIDRPGRLIQRRAPLISAPTRNVSATSAKAIANPTNATRRTVRGGSSDTPNMTASATGTVISWRSAKCSGA